MLKLRIIFLFITCLLSLVYLAQAKAVALPNFYKVNANLFRGGQPTQEGIRDLAKMGIKTVINFRDTDDRVRKEQEVAEKSGMKFFNPHLSNWFAPKDDEIEAILKIIEDPANQPVFIHCKRGADRTGTVVAVYRMKNDGWTEKAAADEAEKFGIGWWQWWMKDYIRDYSKKLSASQNKK